MQRAFAYVAAFTGMGALFAGTLLLAAIVLVDASELGVRAFHCHVLTHAEDEDGMFGMVTALIVQEL